MISTSNLSVKPDQPHTNQYRIGPRKNRAGMTAMAKSRMNGRLRRVGVTEIVMAGRFSCR
jgi:hypothetical protein